MPARRASRGCAPPTRSPGRPVRLAPYRSGWFIGPNRLYLKSPLSRAFLGEGRFCPKSRLYSQSVNRPYNHADVLTGHLWNARFSRASPFGAVASLLLKVKRLAPSRPTYPSGLGF